MVDQDLSSCLSSLAGTCWDREALHAAVGKHACCASRSAELRVHGAVRTSRGRDRRKAR